MTVLQRVPEWNDQSHAGMNTWFSIVADRDLLFHPDDSPETIVSISDNSPVFTPEECKHIEHILDEKFDCYGNDVYEAALPVFLERLGIRYDS